MSNDYVTLFPITHTGEGGKLYMEGEYVSMDHLPPEDVAMLVERKVLIHKDDYDLPQLKMGSPTQVKLIKAKLFTSADVAKKSVDDLVEISGAIPSVCEGWIDAAKKMVVSKEKAQAKVEQPKP